MKYLPFTRQKAFAVIAAGVFSSSFNLGLLAAPAHGLEIEGFGRALEMSEVDAFLDQGRRFTYRGKQLQPIGDWYRYGARYYLLGDGKALVSVDVGKESLSTDSTKPGTHLIRIHETGVPLATQLSTFTTLGWPQSNPDLRVFPQISSALSASTGELRHFPVAPYGREGLLLVAPDLSRGVTRSAYGPVLLMEPGKGLVGMIWPDEKVLAETRDEVSREGSRLVDTDNYGGGTQLGLFEPYANYQWARNHFSWYRKDSQWHLRGLGKTTEAEPHSTSFLQFLQDYYHQLIKTGAPLPWRNFQAGHPGVRALSSDDPKLQQPCNCETLYQPGNQLPLAFEFERPQQLLGLQIDAFGLAGKSLEPRLYTRMEINAVLTAMSSHFAAQGLRMERLNEDHHVVRGGAVKLFVRIFNTGDPSTLAIALADHGATYCVECHHD